ncbi:MAG: hypothetical protein AAF546_08425 [Verrucomicrobiota bacterium]
MSTKLSDLVINGSGLYTVRDAARYARMPLSTLKSWFDCKELARNIAVSEVNGSYLTFLDLVEVIVMRKLRTKYKVSMRAIREALVEARRRWSEDYLFGNKDYRIFTNDREIVILEKDEPSPVQITGKDRGSTYFTEFVDFYDFLLYDQNSPLPLSYKAGTYGELEVFIDPTVLLGRPRVEGSSVSAIALTKAAIAEGSDQIAAKLYNVDTQAVIASRRYCEAIGIAA